MNKYRQKLLKGLIFLKLCVFLLLTPGVAPRGDSSEAVPLHTPEADGGGAEQPAGDAGGRGGEQKECGEAGLHAADPGRSFC